MKICRLVSDVESTSGIVVIASCMLGGGRAVRDGGFGTTIIIRLIDVVLCWLIVGVVGLVHVFFGIDLVEE